MKKFKKRPAKVHSYRVGRACSAINGMVVAAERRGAKPKEWLRSNEDEDVTCQICEVFLDADESELMRAQIDAGVRELDKRG